MERAVEVEQAETQSRFGRLYREHFSDAVRLAYLMTGDRALAEDLAQDAFLRMAGRLAHLRSPDGFGPYLRQTVVNLANAHFRRRKVERNYLKREAARPDVPWTGPDVPERDATWAILQSLPPRQRAAIVLRFYEDMSEAQIAHILMCRQGNVKSLISRGVSKLRMVMKDE